MLTKKKITTKNGIHKMITIYDCPTCGNQVDRYYNNKYCKYCKQRLKWNVDDDSDKYSQPELQPDIVNVSNGDR